MTAKHRRPLVIHRGRRSLAGVAAIALLTVGVAGAPAFAAKGGGKPTGGGGTSSVSCVVNPNPVAVGADYTLVASGLGADRLVNVLISDTGGTTAWNLASDSNGQLSLTWHSYYSGTSNVNFQVNAKHGYSSIGSCSFQVS